MKIEDLELTRIVRKRLDSRRKVSVYPSITMSFMLSFKSEDILELEAIMTEKEAGELKELTTQPLLVILDGDKTYYGAISRMRAENLNPELYRVRLMVYLSGEGEELAKPINVSEVDNEWGV